MSRLDYEISSGNVFRDLGLPDAEELDIKAGLAIEIGQLIRRRGLTQSQAASMVATGPRSFFSALLLTYDQIRFSRAKNDVAEPTRPSSAAAFISADAKACSAAAASSNHSCATPSHRGSAHV